MFHLQVNNASVEMVSVEAVHCKSIQEPPAVQRNVQGLIMFTSDLQSRFQFAEIVKVEMKGRLLSSQIYMQCIP